MSFIKGFKKVKSDDKCTTFRHENGSELKVAHNALSPTMKKKLHELPQHLAEGGEVDDFNGRSPASLLSPEDAQAASAKKLGINDSELKAMADIKAAEGPVGGDVMGPAQPAPTIYDRVNNFLSLPGEADEEALKQWQAGRAVDNSKMAQAPQMQGPSPASVGEPTLASNPDPLGMDAYAKNYLGALGEEKAGIRQEAAAQGQMGKDQLVAEQAQQQFMQKAAQDYQQTYSGLQKEYQAVINDVKNQHINPNHYMENISAGKKVATAIGLILGGMGSGLTGGENPAAKFLQMQIQNDIEAQKANLGKSETLLSANMRQFGNLHDATQMTLAMQNGIYASRLREAAAKSMDPIAKARALQEAGKLDAQAAPIMQQLAMKKAAMGGVQGVQDPAQKIRFGVMAGIIPQGEGEHLYKELGDAQNMVRARDNILSAFEKVNKLNTLYSRTTSPLQSRSQIAAIKDPLVAALSKETAGRFTEQDAKFLDGLFPHVSDNAQTVAAKKQQIDKLISEKMHFPRLQAFGINPLGEQRYGEGGQKKIQLGPPVK
jgi:hypothetical protein